MFKDSFYFILFQQQRPTRADTNPIGNPSQEIPGSMMCQPNHPLCLGTRTPKSPGSYHPLKPHTPQAGRIRTLLCVWISIFSSKKIEVNKLFPVTNQWPCSLIFVFIFSLSDHPQLFISWNFIQRSFEKKPLTWDWEKKRDWQMQIIPVNFSLSSSCLFGYMFGRRKKEDIENGWTS